MNLTQQDRHGEDGAKLAWRSTKEKRKKLEIMKAKSWSLFLVFSRHYIRNTDIFTHLFVIQIFRLSLEPDVHQIPPDKRKMV